MSPSSRPATFRLALDLGTTTLAGRLCAADGTVLAEGKRSNPQAILGADVIRRLEAALAGEGERLRDLLVGGIDELLGELLRQAGGERRDIGRAAACANPAISLLLRGGDPARILFPPHRPDDRGGVMLDPASLGLQLPVPLYLFPLVSGFVGGDLVAFLHSRPQLVSHSFFLDVGTNGEMAYFDGARWWTTSVPAGPAFEGGDIASGMAATPGAIAGVTIGGERLLLDVIGGGPPRGLCGSGLAEAVAAGLSAGLIDGRGRILAPEEVATGLSRYLVVTPAGAALCLHHDAAGLLLLTQADVRAFQLAKGAVRAGIDCLLARAGASAALCREVVVTGAFGLSLRPEVLKRVAMLPAAMVENVLFTPGGALAGVDRALAAPDGYDQVQRLAEQLKPYPLSGTPAFESAFLAALDFASVPH
ncbi:MAG: hypothetical protein A2091_06090 [Desulfuromonadales bacterium GWD2_61_12]|nr:MAG: hypothetical protein A2005_07360 [Desulfuromonadales bacterium GWC2_61_20]OGR36414.1 MAG: hypothetical protein A2091_06090 [Desulfuromonadales bacterium GWD2_61_12]HAD03107.1 hypothetical protein [Desulfuromonas sp.]HBT83811.1 hypothetical protein [Desulfuromonas sp.]